MADPAITLHRLHLQAVLDGIGRRDRRALMQRLGRAVHADVQLRFRQGRAPDGSPWLPLKKPRRRGPGQPLRDTGRLQRSITWQADAASATIGTNVVYARAHNDGVPGAPVRLPQRRFLGIARPQVELINRIADQWLQQVLDGHPA